jgi:hypothetical protein
MDIGNFPTHKAERRRPRYDMFEIGHDDIPRSDWEAFRDAPPRDLIDEVIDRSETELLDYCVPLARGVGVASDSLLDKAGYRRGSKRPRRWHPLRADCSRGWDGVALVSEGRHGACYARKVSADTGLSFRVNADCYPYV